MQKVIKNIENWWTHNSQSKYSQLNVSMSTDRAVTLRFGYWLPINIYDLQKVIGDDYKITGHDISDGEKNEAVFYKVKHK
tara:strand:- start:300 stop:539 length:240 start_codon:yes stop_codon:yes gene_type:complete